MKRGLLGLLLAGVGVAGFLAATVLAGNGPAAALTDTTTSTDTTTTTQTTAPPPPATTTPPAKPKPKPKPVRLPSRVTIGGVHVGGLTPKTAYATVRLAFQSRLVLLLEGKRLSVTPGRLGATPYIGAAVSRAVHAAPGTAVPLLVMVRGADVRSYVQELARKHGRKPRDARAVLRGAAPVVIEERVGISLVKPKTVAAIVAALRENRRGPLTVLVRMRRPAVTSAAFGAIVIIRRESKLLSLYRAEKLVRTFRVATGTSSYPTPLGRYEIVVKWRNPWWYPPPSPWAQGLKPVPPGPGNPLGTRWMGISAPAVGIHGTPDAASLGYSRSHGCIRMAIPSAEWLFEHVKVSTPVFIIPR